VIVGVFSAIGSVVLWETCRQYVYGTTPAQLSAASLVGSSKQVAKELSLTEVHETSVRARFKVSSARPYDYAELHWSRKASTAPNSLRLHHEHSHEDDPAPAIALGRRFHALHDGQWTWGTFSISAQKDGDVDTNVDPMLNSKTVNPLFERQMDAARQVALEAAFGIPPHATDAELAELLGTGYKTADVGKIDPQTTIEAAPALIASRFPGSLHDSSTRWEIAVDHPLLKSVSLYWSNRRGGTVDNISFEVDAAYEASRETLQACLGNVLGAPKIETTDYAAGRKTYVFGVGSLVLTLERTNMTLSTSGLDASSVGKIFDALAGCHEKTENTGARGDGRKK